MKLTMKERLKNGEQLIGTMVSELRIPGVIRMLDTAGLDFVILDAEHGPFNYESLADMAAVAGALNISCLTRVPEISRETIMKPLDMGMDGIVVPQVESAEQAEQIIEYAKYPPMGKRGVALRRGHSAYAPYPAAEYLLRANEKTLIAVQIESPDAVARTEEIISVPGIDIAFVGPFDLSVAMGIPGDIGNEKLDCAIHAVIDTCKKKGIAAGLMQFSIESARKWLAAGIGFMVYSSDVNMITDQARSNVLALHE
ncbi:hypothetical protein LJC14_04825 [Treponema sp. OttesenSCG-928-L16]|nr:hypothetical protein [Treponema sp. OttesenSCG-928-L16]